LVHFKFTMEGRAPSPGWLTVKDFTGALFHRHRQHLPARDDVIERFG
jgi:hypothetical protein